MAELKDVIKEVSKATEELDKSISVKMERTYAIAMLFWMLFNLGIGVAARVDASIIRYFSLMFALLAIGLFIGNFFSIRKYLVEVLNLSIILLVPVTWYMCGGTESSSANSMFIMAIVYFGLCAYGKRRVIGMIVSIAEVGAATGVTKRFPELAHPPYAPGPSVMTLNSSIGFSTTMVIVTLLFKQIREYRNQHERSERYKRDLEQSNKLQKLFLANMSHEIRSPLGIVLGFNELIAKSENINDIREYSHNISSAGETLKVVINDILDYSKIESGKLDIIERDYSLVRMLNEIEKNIRLKASEKGLDFHINIDSNVPDMLFGDDVRIRQCIINILSNAVKYTEKGKISLTVKSETDKQNADGVVLSFSCLDTGRGIKKEALPHLFDAFERVDESGSRTIEGTGLGLAITKTLVDEMNGNICVESTVGVGSEFTIKLGQTISTKKNELVDAEVNLSLDGIRVGVVDDTKPNLILCRKLLELKKASVETFDNGRDFLESCKENKYDILLIDHMMPQMDGIMVLTELKKLEGPNRDTPCLIFTANAMAGAEKEYLDYGFDGFISKPINKDEFAAKLTDVLRR